MKAKDYLQQIGKIDRMIDNKIAEAQRWKEIATSTTSHMGGERVQSSGSKDKLGDAVCRYTQMDQEITADIDRLVGIRQEAINTIEQLPAIEYDILHKIYVQYKGFYEIADELCKSYSWVTTIHGRALKHLQDILDKRSEK